MQTLTSSNEIVLVSCIGKQDEDCACADGAVSVLFNDELVDANNDCACSDRPSSLCRVGSTRTPHFRNPESCISPLGGGFHLAYNPLAPNGPSVLSEAAAARWRSFETPQSLVRPIDHILAEQRLVVPHQQSIKVRFGKPETLTVWLHVTNACNLDCSYCYVRKSSASMNADTGQRVLEQVFSVANTEGFKRVKLKYAGGEATLHWELICQLHDRARKLSATSGIALSEVVLSNGLRLRGQQAAWLGSAQVKLMISLDGIGAVHDRQRPLKGGGPSFAEIERTVDDVLLPNGVRPDVSVTVTGSNAHGIADAVQWALARNLRVSLNLYRQNALSASRAELGLKEDVIIEGMRAAYGVFMECLPVYPFFNGLLDRVQGQAHSHTCGAGISYLVVTHEGKLAQCHMHLEEPVAPQLDDNALDVVVSGWLDNVEVEAKEDCADCLYRFRCTGGCPLETYRVTGKWDVRSPHCRIYRTLLPDALRLEGLRLLKVHGYLV